MRMRWGWIAAAALWAASGAFAQTPDEKLYADRIAWAMAGGDSVLDIAALQPQEVVKGGAGKPLPLRPAEKRRLSPEAAAAAIALVKPLNTQSLLVWRAGALELEWYGEGYDASSRASPASMMKPVTALAIGTAIARGKIKSVDDPVSAYIPQWANDPRGAITLRQLLEMASGLKPFAFDRSPTAPGMRHNLGTDIRATALEAELAETPGASFQYNNVATSLLGIVVENATGMRFADWVSRTLWKPMGAGEAAVWLDRPGGFARTYCCLIARGQDWLRVGLLLKDRGRINGRQIVPAAWVDAMTAPSKTNPNFGYQLWIASPHAPVRGYGPAVQLKIPAAEPFLAEDTIFIDGAGAQRVYVSRSEDLVIVRVGKATIDWDDSRLMNLIVKDLRRP